MKTNIFIPEKINVGFQKRDDTYTKKLAYVIYFDEKGKLRKEASWNSWRNKEIENIIHDNTPMSGFVLNKKVGDYVSDWNHRQAYVRVYDPRDFEFEITIENLLYILENASSIKGKGLEGDFTYGWDGKDLILIPCDSPDYKELEKYNDKVFNAKKFKLKDMILGGTYLTKQNEEWIYLGRFDMWYCGWRGDNIENEGKHYFFYSKNSDDTYRLQTIKSISNKIIDCLNDKCVDNFAELMDKLECDSHYSPVDTSKDEKVIYGKDKLVQKFWSRYWECYRDTTKFYSEIVSGNTKVSFNDYFSYNQENNTIYQKYSDRVQDPTCSWRSIYKEIYVELGTPEEFIETYQPYYIRRYLQNGKFYEEVHNR